MKALNPPAIDRKPDLIRAFLEGRNARTMRAYRQDLEDFRAFVEQPSLESAAVALTTARPGEANALALSYRADLIRRQLAPATVNHRLAALRALVKLARVLGLVGWSLEVPNLPSRSYRDTRGPGVAGFRRLLTAAGSARDRALLWLLYSPALRRAEVCALDLADVEAEALWVLGKGCTQKERVTLPGPAREALSAYLEERGPAAGALFRNAAGGRLSPSGVWWVVRGLGRRSGVPVRPHGLRHTGITEAIKAAQRAGMGLEEVAAFSRHRDVRTLMVYRDAEADAGGRIAGLAAAAV